MPPPTLDFRSVNALWSGVMIETLFRAGLREAVVSPGSRSSPLALAIARHRGVEAFPILDERSAAFFALGLTRRSGRPVLVVCTSGTAVANHHPAVIEAQEGGAPLLFISADRPPEMRACGSGQTIDQQKLFGAHVAFHHEMPVPEASLPMLRYLRQTLIHAWVRTQSPSPAPVHLNAPFRDPLVPEAGAAALTGLEGTDWEAFFAAAEPPPMPAGVPPELDLQGPGIIVAGPAIPADPRAYAAEVGRLAGLLGWPVLADALSPVRQHAALVPGAVSAYDAILRNPAAAARLRPASVLCLGSWPTSKVLRAWMTEADPRVVMIGGRPDNRDCLHGRTEWIDASWPSQARSRANPRDAALREDWAGCERRARAVIDGRLGAQGALFEPKAAWILSRRLPPGTPVFIANSMPVRDVEYVWPAGERALRPCFNRGANGIDGTLSTALGFAHGGPPAVLLTGDLALLHDTNGWLASARLRGSLTVVLVNNGGGGIFAHLPVAREGDVFEDFFATPQRVDFGRLASAYGIGHEVVADWGRFEERVSSLPGSGVRILELRTDRRTDPAGRRALFEEAARAAGEGLSR